jgi:hypothetical protein
MVTSCLDTQPGGFTVNDLRVAPWQGHGEDRFDVFTESGTRVAWFDRGSGRIEIEDEWYRDAALDVLAPYLRGEVSQRLEPAPLPPPRAGLLARLLGGSGAGAPAAPAARRRRAPEAEESAASRLSRLSRGGWRMLKLASMGGDPGDGHVVIGPAGVFLVNTRSAPGARVLVGSRVVSVDGYQHSYLRTVRSEAAKAAKLLTSACGFPVNVTPVLAFDGAASVKASAPTLDVVVARGGDIDRVLERLPARLNPSVSDRIYAAAQAAQTWLAGT